MVRPNGMIMRLGACAALALGLSACASHRGGEASDYKSSTLRPYNIGGKRYTPKIDDGYSEKGLASWYSYPKGTRRTATGESFDPDQLTAAHKTLPLPCVVEVTNLENGKKLKVRVNDRGPFVQGRIIDLSKRAAEKLGFDGKGLVKVKVKFLGPAKIAAIAPAQDLVMLAQVDHLAPIAG
jgi:rare lipoprotein A (peptidoglycan hydrolase)